LTPRQSLTLLSRLNGGKKAADTSMPPPKTLPPGIVGTLRDLSLAAGYSIKTVSEWKNRPGFPVEGDGTYDVWAVCCWWNKQLQMAVKKTPIPEELEPGEGDSPWLEKYREARTHRENLKLEQERKNLIPRQLCHDTLLAIASLIRTASETLQRQFGPDALQVLDATLTECGKLVDATFGADDDDPDSDDGPESDGAQG